MPETDLKVTPEESTEKHTEAMGEDIDAALAEIGANVKACMDKAGSDYSEDILGQIKTMDACRAAGDKARNEAMKR